MKNQLIPWKHGFIESIKNMSFSGTEIFKEMRVHVVSLNIFPYDAVSRHILELGFFFEALGSQVTFHAKGCLEEHRSWIKNPSILHESLTSNDIILYQYSIWDDLLPELTDLPNKKVVFYQGITDPELLQEYLPDCAKDCRIGLDHLFLLSKFNYILTSSNYNLNQIELSFKDNKIKYDPENTFILPPYLTMDMWDGIAEKVFQNFDKNKMNLLYIGRFFANKNIESVLKLFTRLWDRNHDYRLYLVGTGISPEYYKKIREYVERTWKNNKPVFFIHDVPGEQLKFLLNNCTAMIQLSLHEGFCVPLVEAMKFSLPIITHNVTAIPETMKGSGIIIDSNNIESAVTKIDAMLKNDKALSVIKEDESRVYNQFYTDMVVLNKYYRTFSNILQ